MTLTFATMDAGDWPEVQRVYVEGHRHRPGHVRERAAGHAGANSSGPR